MEIYKVHHHCSAYSTNDPWIKTLRPKVAIISTGNGNTYRHPAEDCVNRLHAATADMYWTEKGASATPDRSDPSRSQLHIRDLIARNHRVRLVLKSVRLPEPIIGEIEVLAERTGATKQGVVVALLNEGLEAMRLRQE